MLGNLGESNKFAIWENGGVILPSVISGDGGEFHESIRAPNLLIEVVDVEVVVDVDVGLEDCEIADGANALVEVDEGGFRN